MIFGFPFGVGFGDHTWMFTYVRLQAVGTSGEYLLSWVIEDELDGYYRIAIAGAKIGVPIYCMAGQLYAVILKLDGSQQLVSICPQGQFGDGGVIVQDQIDAHYEDGLHFQKTFSTIIYSKPTPIVSGSTQFSALAVAGMQRGRNVASVKGRPSWGVLDLALSTLAGVHTMTASVNGQVMLTGSRTGNGAMVLRGAGAEIDVTLTYTGDFTTGVKLLLRWPAKFNIYVRSIPFSPASFPQVPFAIKKDDGVSNAFFFKSPTIKAGTYYVVIHSVADDGSESTADEGGGTVVTVYEVPDPVLNLAYLAGGALNTDISWDCPASNPLVSYDIYDSGDTGKLLLTTPTETHAAGNHNIKRLPAIAAAFTGDRYVVVRSVEDGVEEDSLNLITIEYLLGVVVSTRPEMATCGWNFTVNGRDLYAPTTVYVDDPNLVYPASVELYLYADGAAPDFTTPSVSVPMPGNAANVAVVVVQSPLRNGAGALLLNENGDQLYASALIVTAPGDGVYFWRVGTTSAAGSKTINPEVYGPVILSFVPLADPSFLVGV